jgi:diguanylate cyclase (GGDEF)-like protein
LEISGGLAQLTDAIGGEAATIAQLGLSDARLIEAEKLAQQALAIAHPQVCQIGDGWWLAATPLLSGSQALGVISLLGGPACEIPDLTWLEGLGRQIGTGVDNARLYLELRSAAQRSEALSRISRTLASSSELASVIPGFAAELAGLQPFDRLATAFVDDSGDYLEVIAHPADTSWGLGGVIPVVGSGLGFVVLNDRPVLLRDLLHKHRFIEDMRLLEEGIRSYVLLPLTARQRTIGVLALGSKQAAAYDELTLARMQPLANAVALALENLRLFQKTRELSITDEVTPLYNVRFFHQILDRELKLVDRYKSMLSLLFIDLDNFKPINDKHGHLRGTRVLREVGFLISELVRETDYPVRYGGDEFCVVLPQTDSDAARNFAERLRKSIESHTFLQEEGIDARLGVSLGVATYPMEAATKEALIRLSDARMYEDKGERRAR